MSAPPVPSASAAGAASPKETRFQKATREINSKQFAKEVVHGKRIGYYKIRSDIGAGNFAQVKLAYHTLTNEKVAIKIVDKTKLDLKTEKLLQGEVVAMEGVHHPNILRLYEVIETHSKLYMIMEFAPKGDLFSRIHDNGRMDEEEAKTIFADVIAGIAHCHDKGIIHRDIKAQNLLFDSFNMVKVADFGFSTITNPSNLLNTFCGSPPYAAPELFREEVYDGTKVDVWALGILLYFMVTGNMPFEGETVTKLKQQVLAGTHREVPPFVSEDCKDLILSILVADPKARPTVRDLMSHRWFEGCVFREPDKPPATRPEDAGSDSEVEEAVGLIKEIGITNSTFALAPKEDARNQITGTYRIALHKVQKTRLRANSQGEDEGEESNLTSTSGGVASIKERLSFSKKNSTASKKDSVASKKSSVASKRGAASKSAAPQQTRVCTVL
eukprot:Opistho-1_new@84393